MSQTIVFNPEQDRMELNKPQERRKSLIFGGQQDRRETGRTANVLILDHSGSTADHIGRGDTRPKIMGIIEAATQFVIGLPGSAQVAIVTFESIARVLVPLTMKEGNTSQICRAIQSLKPAGFTAQKEGLALGEKELRKACGQSFKRAYLLGDGIHTTGDPLSEAENIKKQGIQLHTIGFGDKDSIDEELMIKMASVSSEKKTLYYHFLDARKMSALFKRESTIIRR